MYLIHNKRMFVVAKRSIRTFKNKVYKYITSISKKVLLINYMEKLISKTIKPLKQSL